MMVTYCPKFEIPTLFGSKNIGFTNSLKKFTWSTLKVNISKTKNVEAFKLCNNVDLELINLQARNQSFMPNCLDLKKKKQKNKVFWKNSKILRKTMRFYSAVLPFYPEHLSSLTPRLLETGNLEDFQKVETFMEQKIYTWLLITEPTPRFKINGYVSPKIVHSSPKKKHSQFMKNLTRFRKKGKHRINLLNISYHLNYRLTL